MSKAITFLEQAGEKEAALFLIDYQDSVEKHRWGKNNYMYVFDDGSAILHANDYFLSYPGRIKWNKDSNIWEDVGDIDEKAQIKLANQLLGYSLPPC